MTDTKITAANLKAMKGGKKFLSLTAYDFPMSQLLGELGIPLILVGDSLGMVVLGYPDTTHVTLEDIEHHLRAVARAKPGGLVAADLPFGTYNTPEAAVRSARRLVAAGAEAVKAEGGAQILPQIQAIIGAGIPFIGHLGMLPQSVLLEGGYHIKGKIEAEHQSLLHDCDLLCEAGAIAMVLELVTPSVASELTRRSTIPTIGIGSGHDCDAQILVTTDLLGMSPGFIPRHVKLRGDFRADARRIITEWGNQVCADPKAPL